MKMSSGEGGKVCFGSLHFQKARNVYSYAHAVPDSQRGSGPTLLKASKSTPVGQADAHAHERTLSGLTGSSGHNEKSDAAFRGLAGRRLPHRAMSSIRERVKSFLDGTPRALAIVGPSGTGKLYATQQAARERGLTCIVHDRSQGSINYRLWGAATLANHGLAASVHVLLSADGETDFCFVANLPNSPVDEAACCITLCIFLTITTKDRRIVA